MDKQWHQCAIQKKIFVILGINKNQVSTNQNIKSIPDLISANSQLFWWVPENRKKNIPIESLVEAILNYGDAHSVRQLFEIYGIKKVSEIFFKQIEKERSNYLPQVKYYFSLYFNKHA